MPNGLPLFLIYDYIHIYKNLRNNWISESLKQLSFHIDGREYLACWSDIVNLYEEDEKNPICLTKLTHTSIYPKPLQRRSVSLVHQVFNEKNCAALKELSAKINISLGTLLFVQIISGWFKIMNIKDKFIHQHLNDNLRVPWSQNCESFTYLVKVCDVIASQLEGGRLRQKKLTKFTASAFVVTTKNVISAANYLLHNYDFHYVLPAVFSQNPLKKCFGQARQRIGGNFYIDINDVTLAAKAQRPHQFIKNDIIPVDREVKNICTYCDFVIPEDDLNLVAEFNIDCTQGLLDSMDILKQSYIYSWFSNS